MNKTRKTHLMIVFWSPHKTKQNKTKPQEAMSCAFWTEIFLNLLFLLLACITFAHRLLTFWITTGSQQCNPPKPATWNQLSNRHSHLKVKLNRIWTLITKCNKTNYLLMIHGTLIKINFLSLPHWWSHKINFILWI